MAHTLLLTVAYILGLQNWVIILPIFDEIIHIITYAVRSRKLEATLVMPRRRPIIRSSTCFLLVVCCKFFLSLFVCHLPFYVFLDVCMWSQNGRQPASYIGQRSQWNLQVWPQFSLGLSWAVATLIWPICQRLSDIWRFSFSERHVHLKMPARIMI